jgi:hypothetical protein
MAQSQLNLYNMAVSVCGADFTISATNESTVPAEVCELWYENTRQTILRAAHWNSAKRYFRLVEEAERDTAADWVSTDPEPGYAYSYEVPSNMLAARYLSTFEQFSLGYETDQKIISANTGSDTASETPILCYTVDVTDVTLYEPDLYQAMIYGLAGHICMPLTGKTQRARNIFALANQILFDARAATANEMHRLMQYQASRMAARGFNQTTYEPFIYPYGAVFTQTGAPLV